MKILILVAMVVFFSFQSDVVKAETECPQCHKSEIKTVRNVREFR